MTSVDLLRGFAERAHLLDWGSDDAGEPDLPRGAVQAPWTLKQVRRLNVRQGDPRAQSYYCPNCSATLLATRFGWMCPRHPRHFRQAWALDRHINDPLRATAGADVILIDDVMPQRVQSTAAFIQSLSDLVPGGISYPVEQLVLRYLVDTRPCPLCKATAGFQCHTMGSQNLRRTHLERLAINDFERKVTVEWARLEHERQRREAD